MRQQKWEWVWEHVLGPFYNFLCLVTDNPHERNHEGGAPWLVLRLWPPRPHKAEGARPFGRAWVGNGSDLERDEPFQSDISRTEGNVRRPPGPF